MAVKVNRRPSRAEIARSLREAEILWRPPEKDKPGARGDEQTGPDTKERHVLNSTAPRAKRKAAE